MRWPAKTAPARARWSRSSAASTSRRRPHPQGRPADQGAVAARQPHATASRSCTSIRRCFPTSPSPRTSSSAASRGAAARSTGGHAPALARAAGAAQRRYRRRHAGQECSASPSGSRSRSASALSIDARVLVLDEPTSALSGREVDPAVRDRRHAEAARRGRHVHQPFHRRDHEFQRRRDDPALRPARRHRRHRRTSRPRPSCAP